MSEEELIVCRPTKWFLWRALAMLALFAFFSVWFLKDWKSGYPGKNRVYFTYRAFDTARQEFPKREAEGQTAAEWKSFISERTMADVVRAAAGEEARRTGKSAAPEEVETPPGIGMDGPWPAVLGDYEAYRKAFDEDGGKAAPPMWVSYTDQQKWDSKKPQSSYSAAKVRNQLIYAIISAVLALGVAVFLARTMKRSLRVDREAFHGPDGTRIPFSAIRRIDKRKWDSKGLATLYYEEGGETRKAKVDGMVYGQFKAEDGAPAEQLFQRILANFSGELVELEEREPAKAEIPGDSGEKGDSGE